MKRWKKRKTRRNRGRKQSKGMDEEERWDSLHSERPPTERTSASLTPRTQKRTRIKKKKKRTQPFPPLTEKYVHASSKKKKKKHTQPKKTCAQTPRSAHKQGRKTTVHNFLPSLEILLTSSVEGDPMIDETQGVLANR